MHIAPLLAAAHVFASSLLRCFECQSDFPLVTIYCKSSWWRYLFPQDGSFLKMSNCITRKGRSKHIV